MKNLGEDHNFVKNCQRMSSWCEWSQFLDTVSEKLMKTIDFTKISIQRPRMSAKRSAPRTENWTFCTEWNRARVPDFSAQFRPQNINFCVFFEQSLKNCSFSSEIQYLRSSSRTKMQRGASRTIPCKFAHLSMGRPPRTAEPGGPKNSPPSVKINSKPRKQKNKFQQIPRHRPAKSKT